MRGTVRLTLHEEEAENREVLQCHRITSYPNIYDDISDQYQGYFAFSLHMSVLSLADRHNSYPLKSLYSY